MRIIKPNAQLLDVTNLHPYQIIERIGRICYKSEDIIGEGTDIKFVKAMRKNRHFAMLEHGHVFMLVDPLTGYTLTKRISENPQLGAYINISDLLAYDSCKMHLTLISGSFRALIELFENIHIPSTDYDRRNTCGMIATLNNALAAEYPEMFEPYNESPNGVCRIITREELINDVAAYCLRKDALLKKHLPHTVIFTCDRGVSHEFVRHRPASFAQESTRYCNYFKEKFGNEITVIDPCFLNVDGDETEKEKYNLWKESCEAAEKAYLRMLEIGCTAQEARDVLPTSLKTEIAITATEKEWHHIINLRYHGVTGKPHPQMVEVMTIAYPQLMDVSNNRCDTVLQDEVKTPLNDIVVPAKIPFKAMKVKKLTDTAIVPTRGSDGAAGFDLYADSVDDAFNTYKDKDGNDVVVCAGGSKVKVHTGIAMAIPEGYVGLVFPRSGLATKKGLRLSNCVGVIDEDYRGEIMVSLRTDIDFADWYKDDAKPVASKDFVESFVEFNLHDRIAQIVFVKYDVFNMMVVDELDSTIRGDKGFGSTGNN